MRDQRAEALAQILVRYSTKVTKGDVCVIQCTTTAEPLVQAVYEEVLRAGGLPILQHHPRRGGGRVLPAGLRRAARLGPAHVGVGRRERRRADRDHGRRQLARAVPRRPQEAGPLAEGPQGADGDLHAPLGGRRVPLGAHALSRPTRTPSEAGMSLSEYEDFYYAGVPRHRRRPGHRLAAPVRRGQPAGRVDGGQGGGARDRPRHRHHAGGGRPHLDPLHRPPQHARRRVLHRARRGLGGGRGGVLVSRPPTAAARSRACGSGSRAARSWTRPPSAARSS